MEAIRVLIVDDQTLLRDGLQTILDLEEDIQVVGSAENGEKAISLCKSLLPDVVLMDIRMPVLNGVAATKEIKERHPQIKVVMLTTFQDEEYIIEALLNGAEGYLLKDIPGDKLIDAVRDAKMGRMMMPPEIARKLAGLLKKQPDLGLHAQKDFELSDREMEIARLMTQGSSNKDIAKTLFISEGTVKNYISTIYAKIGTSDRTKAVLLLKNYR